jgi:hypothetical protein
LVSTYGLWPAEADRVQKKPFPACQGGIGVELVTRRRIIQSISTTI